LAGLLNLYRSRPGDLDPTFAGTGITRFGFAFADDFPHAVRVQGDGKRNASEAVCAK
jgi:hypothetical protein